jgi:hypothetical protein
VRCLCYTNLTFGRLPIHDGLYSLLTPDVLLTQLKRYRVSGQGRETVQNKMSVKSTRFIVYTTVLLDLSEHGDPEGLQLQSNSYVSLHQRWSAQETSAHLRTTSRAPASRTRQPTASSSRRTSFFRLAVAAAAHASSLHRISCFLLSLVRLPPPVRRDAI